jgi:hypothetical protein
VRRALQTHEGLPALLRALDARRGPEREEELQIALGVAPRDNRRGRHAFGLSETREYTESDQMALREVAEAIEAAVRGGQENVLGLDWDA